MKRKLQRKYLKKNLYIGYWHTNTFLSCLRALHSFTHSLIHTHSPICLIVVDHFERIWKRTTTNMLNCSNCVNIMSSTHHTIVLPRTRTAEPLKNLHLIELDEWGHTKKKKSSTKKRQKKNSERSKELNEREEKKAETKNKMSILRFVFVDLMMWMFARWCVLQKHVTKFPVFHFDLYWMVGSFCWLAQQWFCHLENWAKFTDATKHTMHYCRMFSVYLLFEYGCCIWWILLEQGSAWYTVFNH